MSMQDPIGDMFTRIRNAMMVKKETVSMPLSRHKKQILTVLHKEGYIQSFDDKALDENNKPILIVKLKYFEGKSVIEKIKQISKPGLRIYKSFRKLSKIKNGMGIAIISTSKGVLSDHEAREKQQGGEVLVEVY
jgi:small subunit ribosomal protein S8